MNKVKYKWTYHSVGCKYKDQFYVVTIPVNEMTKTINLYKLDLSIYIPAWFSSVSKIKESLEIIKKSNAVDIYLYLQDVQVKDLVEIAEILSCLEVFEFNMIKNYKSVSDKNLSSLIKTEELRKKLSEEIKNLDIRNCSRLMQNIKRNKPKAPKAVVNG